MQKPSLGFLPAFILGLFINIVLLHLVFTPSAFSQEENVRLTLKVFPRQYQAVSQNTYLNKEKILKPDFSHRNKNTYLLKRGEYRITITAHGYYHKTLSINLNRDIIREVKLERKNSFIHKIGEIKTGNRPKSVNFNRDSSMLLTSMLAGAPVVLTTQIPALKEGKSLQFPKQYKEKGGFVEAAFLPKHKEIWFSQMSTAMVHAVDSETLNYKYSISTKGNWSKVIEVDHNEQFAYVTNWISQDISVIDIEKRKSIARIKTEGIPRGMCLTPDGTYLYVCIFSTGNIQKIDTETRKVIHTFHTGPGAKRHIVIDETHEVFYISDMAHGTITTLAYKKDKVLNTSRKIGTNINTIALSPDNRFLFVSERGKNNPESYWYKGPAFGRVLVLNPGNMEIVDWTWGGNQPTGLTVSSDMKYLVFSNFLDYTLEVYDISSLWQGQPTFFTQ